MIQAYYAFQHFEIRLVWLFFPQLSWVLSAFPKNWHVVFDIVDFYTHPIAANQLLLESQAKAVLKRANTVTAISSILAKKYQHLFNKKIPIVPQGCLVESADQINSQHSRKLRGIKQPLIGYIGAISERLDLDLLETLITKNPQWMFVFIGPIAHDPSISVKPLTIRIKKMLDAKNVIWINQLPKKEVFSLVPLFNVGIIPYDLQHAFNTTCYPMKLFDYFLAEIPVVSTPMTTLLGFKGLVKVGSSASEWEDIIRTQLKKEWSHKYRSRQKRHIQENTWQKKVQAISTLVMSHAKNN